MHEINPADISGEFYDYTRTMEPETPYNYDYSKTLTMKLALAIPDRKGGSKVFCNFEEALEIIRRVDAITRGIPKIVYLVGWQYCGHDDKYPAMDEVNPYLKRPRDETAEQSLILYPQQTVCLLILYISHVKFVHQRVRWKWQPPYTFKPKLNLSVSVLLSSFSIISFFPL